MKRCPLWQADSKFKRVLLDARKHLINDTHGQKLRTEIDAVCKELDSGILGLTRCAELEGVERDRLDV